MGRGRGIDFMNFHRSRSIILNGINMHKVCEINIWLRWNLALHFGQYEYCMCNPFMPRSASHIPFKYEIPIHAFHLQIQCIRVQNLPVARLFSAHCDCRSFSASAFEFQFIRFNFMMRFFFAIINYLHQNEAYQKV